MDEADVTATVRAAATGDPAAFATLVRATQAEVTRACRALVDHGSADDLVQDTYMRAFRALPTYRATGTFRGWILGIARHVCADELRRRTRRRALLRRLGPAGPSSPSSNHAAATELELLVAALPPDQREAFVLTQLIGLSYDEAAQACQCPTGTIRSRVARARASLIDRLDDAAQIG